MKELNFIKIVLFIQISIELQFIDCLANKEIIVFISVWKRLTLITN